MFAQKKRDVGLSYKMFVHEVTDGNGAHELCVL